MLLMLRVVVWMRGVVVVSCCAVCALALTNNAVCTFKTLPCLPSKRPCHIRHGRFDGKHGSVLKVHMGASWADSLSVSVGGWYIARVQYSSFGEGAAVVSLGAVDMEEGVQVRVQVG